MEREAGFTRRVCRVHRNRIEPLIKKWARNLRQGGRLDEAIREDSGEGKRRRAAIELHPLAPGPRGFTAYNPQTDAGHQGWTLCGRRRGEEDRRDHRGSGARELRAARGGPDARPLAAVRGSGIRVHRAMVRSVTPAAKGQAHIFAPRQKRGNGRQPEKKNQRNGQSTAHRTQRMTIMPPRLETWQFQNGGQV